MAELREGMVAAIVKARARARTRQEWEGHVASMWDGAIGLLRQNPGFKGLAALWDVEDSGEVIIIGLWESLEARLNYEARSAPGVRALFDQLFQEVPQRPRYYVTRAHGEPLTG